MALLVLGQVDPASPRPDLPPPRVLAEADLGWRSLVFTGLGGGGLVCGAFWAWWCWDWMRRWRSVLASLVRANVPLLLFSVRRRQKFVVGAAGDLRGEDFC